jgi:hypothetical protein
MGVTLEGAAELEQGFQALADTTDIATANGAAGQLVADIAAEFVPDDSGELASTIDYTETDAGVVIGSDSPYARWFHVPFLSQGGVTYAKKESRRGRSYGQRIPDNPFMFQAAEAAEEQIKQLYDDGVAAAIDKALP